MQAAKIKKPAGSKQLSSWETFMAQRAKLQAELDQGSPAEPEMRTSMHASELPAAKINKPAGSRQSSC